LNENNRHMLNGPVIARCKPGVRVVNVARGPLIDEEALIQGQATGQVAGCALDVFESEPPTDTQLARFNSSTIFGSHNSSNTEEAVVRTSKIAIDLLNDFLTSHRTAPS
jgi:D-3-phosphoglycerate dehydrogenase